MIKIIIFLVILFIFSNLKSSFSQTDVLLDLLSDLEGKDAEVFQDEMNWLRAEDLVMTNIATKTKMDADLVPGIVTILHGNDLKKLGIRNVLESLTLVPGIDVIRSGDGAIQIIVRGIGKVFASGKVKVLLNNIPMNGTMSGEPDAAIYLMPIEQIERIEIIRGPGSVLYGKWAYAGVINVITHQEQNRFFVSYGKFNERSIGGVFSYANPEQDFKIGLNITGWEKDMTDTKTGTDLLHEIGMSEISEAPGTINDDYQLFSGLLSLNYKDLFLMGQYSQSSAGSFFGMADILPPLDNNHTQNVRNFVLEGGLDTEISESFKWRLWIGWREYCFDLDNMYLFPPGYYETDNENKYTVYEDGLIIGPHYKGNSLYSGTEFWWKGWKYHNLLFDLEYERSQIADAWMDINYHPIRFEPLPYVKRFQGKENWIKKNQDREIFSIFAQDQFEISNYLKLTAGLRYEHYDDTGDKLTPRIAGVFQTSEHHIFKTQYAEAFRPPTFMEMYSQNNPVVLGNPDINPETVKTWELEYIFKTIPFISRFTIFFSELDNLIIWKDCHFTNSGGARTRGAELKFKYKIIRSLMTSANLSYADTKNRDTGEAIEGAARWIGNLGILYQPLDNLLFSLRYHYVGEQSRNPNDPRGDLSDYDSTDITMGIKKIFIKGLSFYTGVRNLFDKDIRYPSAYPGYIGDYPQSGQEWWVRFSYDFD